VHEIFAGLGLNFAAQGIILWLIFGPWKRPGVASMSGTELFPQELWLTPASMLNLPPAGLALVLLAAILTAVLLINSRIGLNLKAIGNNSTAAFLFGLKPDRYMLIAMLFAGGLAGLAGNFQVAGVYHRLLRQSLVIRIPGAAGGHALQLQHLGSTGGGLLFCLSERGQHSASDDAGPGFVSERRDSRRAGINRLGRLCLARAAPKAKGSGRS
jgi:hypothetical protein